MPAHKRSAPTPLSPQSPSYPSPDLVSDGSDEEQREDDQVKEETANGDKESEGERVEEEEEEEAKDEESKPKDTSPDPPQLKREEDDSDAEVNSDSNGAGEEDEFIVVKLAEIRKEVQCPICLGIIRKTRTVMECLHRFCRDCIDKSMRLSNNECPACRTHCASRRSLRDDPNFDALISALYPDIDKYEEEELAFSEEERTRNKKIQACIAETFRRQTEALGKRKSVVRGRNSRRRARGRGRSSGADNIAGSEDDEEEANGNDGSKESSSADEQSPPDDVRQPKRRRRWPSGSARSSPAKSNAGTSDDAGGGEESNEASGIGKETHISVSPLKSGNMEVLSWGKNGARSQNRHAATGSLAGRLGKVGGRVTRLVEHLRSLDENNNEVDVHLSLFPLDGESMPNLEKPYICCKQTWSIKQLCQFVAVNLSRQVEEIEIYAKKPELGLPLKEDLTKDQEMPSALDWLELLEPEKSLSELHPTFSFVQGNLDLLYALKLQK
ncbi:putative E3 ubiquitin-protein ligase RING1b isoform X2 [Carex rostrata]